MALQKDQSLDKRPEYVTFALFFIMFGLAIVAACLNLMVLKFMTLNTEDERRDEQQAIQVLQCSVLTHRIHRHVCVQHQSHIGERVPPPEERYVVKYCKNSSPRKKEKVGDKREDFPKRRRRGDGYS